MVLMHAVLTLNGDRELATPRGQDGITPSGPLGLTQAIRTQTEHLTTEGLLSPTPPACVHDTDHVQGDCRGSEDSRC